jgi:hypothetical protein
MKNWTECSLAQHRFVSSVYLLVRVTMVDKNRAVVCCLLATSNIMLTEKKKRKRKMWSKKCYLKRNVTCAALCWINCYKRMLKLYCLEVMPSCFRQVNWGTSGILWVNGAVFCVKGDWKWQFWGLRYCLSKIRSLLSFPSRMTSHSKIVQFNWECIWRLIYFSKQ